jgi:4-amino-4-deoxy-L-arabinose transferase-like glycosyltransferase
MCASAPGGFAAVAALATLVFFFHLGTYGLWEPDEARYAEIAREMLVTGHFVVPHLNYVPYVEKPPLLYWFTASAMRVFGVNEFGARLVNAVAALIGVLATCFFASRAFDHRRATLAGLVLTTSGLYAVMAQVLTTDMLLTATITIALFSFFQHWRDGGRWYWIFYLAMDLAVLTKGPVGAAIPLSVAAIFLWWERELSGVLRRFHVLSGFFLSIAICTPWFLAIAIREPDFLDFYFIGEHLRRFFESGYSHSQPFYYYVPVTAAAMLPWTLLLPFLPWRQLEPNPARRFCVIAAATTLVLFTIASSKLIPYILPALPVLAIIIADAILTLGETTDREVPHPELSVGVNGSDLRRLSMAGLLLGLVGAGVIAVALDASHLTNPYPTIVRPALYIAGGIAITGGVLCFAAFWRNRLAAGLAVFIAATTAILIVASYGRILAEPTRSYARLAREIELRAPGAVLVCYPRYIQSLPFYCHRRVILVGAKTELTYGADHSRDAAQFFFTGRTDLLRLWKEPQPTVLVIDRRALPPLEQSLGTFKVIASDSKKLALVRVDQSARGESGW